VSASAPVTAPVFGLILAGGSSSRMQRDKAALPYQGKSQLDRAFDLAARHVGEVFVSVRASQAGDPLRSHRPLIIDSVAGEGPIVGIRSALAARPDIAWLVLACDLPFLGDAALAHLLAMRDADALATAYRSSHDGTALRRVGTRGRPRARRVPGGRRTLPAQVFDAQCRPDSRAARPSGAR
jgi:molybdopterin-guanine dinucleotide biosynthesis protein A